MTRFLLAAMPAAGHIGPLLPVARELAGRGHEVACLVSNGGYGGLHCALATAFRSSSSAQRRRSRSSWRA